MRKERIHRRKLSDEVAARIEQAIRGGEIAIGGQLPPARALMERYGVGKPAVREALYSLKKMGLIEIYNGERARVIEPTPEVLIRELSGAARHLLARPEGIRKFQQARLLFEVALARHAAEFATPDDIAALAEVLRANKAAIGNDLEFERTDMAFHYRLAEIPRNEIFTAIHEAMIEWLRDQMRVTFRIPNSDANAYEDHAAIWAAIDARDPQQAEQAMRKHLTHVSEDYWLGREAGPEAARQPD